MRFRPVHLAMLLFQAIWLNVIVPGHQRGIVQLPGPTGITASATQPTPAADESCPFCQSSPAKSDPSKPAPASKPAGNCAVCFFAAHMGLPPVIVWPLEPLGLSRELPAWRAQERVPAIVLLPFNSRGPPTLV